jgi:putative membrane protein
MAVTTDTKPVRPLVLRLAGAGLLAISLLATAAMVTWWGAAGIAGSVWRALPALPAATAVHMVQLLLSALAWRCLLAPPRLGRAAMGLIRWVREALNTLLPIGGLSGAVASARMLAREAKLPVAEAGASVTADLTVEALAQLPFLLLTVLVISLIAPDKLTPRQALWVVLPVVAAAVAFIVAQRMGLMRLVEFAGARLGFGRALAGMHGALMGLHRQPGRVGRALVWHTASWCLGGAEVWIVLRAIGHGVSPAAAFAIEGLGMAARSAGFALPAGLAAQEAGFVLAGSLFGVPAADSVALSMVKRLRELVVCLPGLLVWQVSEMRGRARN